MSSSSSLVCVIEERTTPLLQSSSSGAAQNGVSGGEEEIAPFSNLEANEPVRSKSNSTKSSQRLVSLDVFRGLTVALMILVDDAGGALPSINHSPWFGVTLADFVMPFFLFGVGFSIGLVFKTTSNKITATKKVTLRTIKLFVLGLALQGGYFHGRHHLTYGVDIERIRWLGILQRISIGYFLAAISEIWLVTKGLVDSVITFIKKYYIQWLVAILLCLLYVGLVYYLYVPNWEFEAPNKYSALLAPAYGSRKQTVICGVRGSMEPPCNAVGLIDRFFLGEKHLYQNPVYRRTKECSINSPDYGPLPPNSPAWCVAPFDPEGILSSLMATVTCFVGLHYGHMIVLFKSHTQRILWWVVSSLMLLLSGYLLKVLGMPVSKPLYTLSYMCITAGASGIVLTVIYYAVDVKNFQRPTVLFQWMGMNALIVYALAASELFPVAIQGLYWRSPANNLVDSTELLLQHVLHSKRWGTLAFVLLEILFWCLVAGYLHIKRIYVKL